MPRQEARPPRGLVESRAVKGASDKRRRAVAWALPAVVLLAFPSLAGANTYCIAEPSCPAGATVEAPNGEGIQTALTAAASHAGSTVLIGPGTFTRASGYTYSGPAVTISGAGPEATKLTRTASSATTVFGLTAAESATPALRDLAIEVPAGNDMTALGLVEGLVEDVALRSPAGATVATGLALNGGVFAAGTISVLSGTGVEGGNGEVRDSRVNTDGFVTQARSGARFRRDRFVVEASYGILSYYPASLLVEDSLIDLHGNNAAGVSIVGNGNGNAHATLRGLTIVGGAAGARAIEVEANNKASSTVTIADTAIYGVEHPVYQVAEGSGSTTSVTGEYSSFDTSGDAAFGVGGAAKPPAPTLTHQLSAPTGFLLALPGPAEGDWRLAPGALLIDAGSPGALGEGESATDLAGNARIVHGTRDVGAYEYQWRALSATASASSTTAEIGRPVTFTGAGLAAEPGDAIASYQWTFDDGASVPAAASATHAFTSAGVHTATFTATDLAGLTSSATVSVAVSAKVCSGTGCGACGEALSCPRLRSVVRGLRIRPSAFRAAARGTAIAAKGGAKVTYEVRGSVSRVDFTISRLSSGVMKGSACVKRSGRSHGRACTRTVKVATFSRISPSGGNGFRLTGRVGGHALAPGRYRLTGIPASGTTAAAGASAQFQILR